jgi:hypothetical protein
MVNANVLKTTRSNASVPNAKMPGQISDADLEHVSGGFFPFVALGVALGIAYCIADGTLDPPPAPKGDFSHRPEERRLITTFLGTAQQTIRGAALHRH